MSQRFDFYLARDSWLHRMDPRAKLWAIVLAGLTCLMFKEIPVLATLLVLAHLLLLSAHIPADRLRWLWGRLMPLLIMILILQPFFAPGPGPDLVALGPIRLTVGGILEGVSFSLRAATLAFVAAVLLLSTDPALLVQGMVKLGMPYPWGLTVGLAIRYLPTSYSLFVTISEAQQARGWIAGDTNFIRRVRSYLPVLVATIIAALRLSDNLGLALAARGLGYPARRTVLRDVQLRPVDWVAIGLVAAAFAGLVVVRFGLGWGAGPL
jgi:energy-coupling factor transport system permease protein